MKGAGGSGSRVNELLLLSKVLAHYCIARFNFRRRRFRHHNEPTCPVKSQKSTIPMDQTSVALVARQASPDTDASARSGAQYLPSSRGAHRGKNNRHRRTEENDLDMCACRPREGSNTLLHSSRVSRSKYRAQCHRAARRRIASRLRCPGSGSMTLECSTNLAFGVYCVE